MQPLKFDDAMMVANGSILECPACGGENLHQERVDSWFREEDATHGVHTSAMKDGGCFVSPELHGNPSARRDGLTIAFSCEGCDRISSLAVVQHKGLTLVGWL